MNKNVRKQKQIKWIKPEKISFGNEAMIVAANCSTGIGDAASCVAGLGCISGSGNASDCTYGNTALYDCSLGISAVGPSRNACSDGQIVTVAPIAQ